MPSQILPASVPSSQPVPTSDEDILPLKVKRKNRRIQYKTSKLTDLASASSSSSSGYASSESEKRRQKRKRQEKTAQFEEIGRQPCTPNSSPSLDIKSVASIPECDGFGRGRQTSNVTSEVRLSCYDKGRGPRRREKRTAIFVRKEAGETTPLSDTQYKCYGAILINVSILWNVVIITFVRTWNLDIHV